MRLVRDLLDMPPLDSGSSLTFGTFDGVHLGHQLVIKRTVERGREEGLFSVVISFDPHPMKFIDPDKAPPVLTVTRKKLEAMEELGVDMVVLTKLEPPLSEMSAADFVREVLVGKLKVRRVVVGPDCSFGKGGVGNVGLLRSLGSTLGFEVEVVPKQKVEGIPISSTRIRKAVLEGDLELAEMMLGRRYSVMGRVIEGDKLGRRIGYPTANLDVGDQALPPKGVYVVLADAKGKRWGGLLNIGTRPTISGTERRVELHLLGFEGDLYGEEVEVEFMRRLRDEIRFRSLAELKAQIERDEKEAREILARLQRGGFYGNIVRELEAD